MSKIKHIVYDIGKVLIKYDPEIPFKQLIPDDERRKWFLSEICTNEWNLEQDRGRSWAEAENILIAKHPEQATLIRAFRTHWHEMVHGEIDGAVETYTALIDAGHDVTLLTNFSQETYPEAQKIFPFLTKARGVTVSGDVRLLKPDPAIYDLHCKTFDLDPAATLFVDDSLKNVEGARAAGWYAEHFIDIEKWRSDLADHGFEL